MNKIIRYWLFLPFSILYRIITGIRNWLYDVGILQSIEKDTAIISIGNITAGGTGKTPHTEHLIAELQSLFRVAVLSRGYKRKTKGFVLADNKSNSSTIGDEPFQIYKKFENIPIAVCENRSKGIDQLLTLYPNLDVIILDDAFQHRRIKAGLSVLLTDFKKLHTRDSVLPGGNLRESARGSKRADIIVVTKCPLDIKPIDMRVIQHEVQPTIFHQVYFSSYKYDEPLPLYVKYASRHWLFRKIKERKASILLVTGIVAPQMIYSFLSNFSDDIKTINYKDHHDFSRKDLNLIEKKFYEIPNPEKLILVTEKDAARLISNRDVPKSLKYHIFVLPIRVNILNNKETAFLKKITDYVAENSGNRRLLKKHY
ncbi:MAG: tetraacyldisaccharide 4'-kinase [Bacteroidales bacterium 36-12]|nr:MAG: tetraacyldisaccharide 4'-kinase [Bacteroidales bacterium 36-12]